MNRCKNGILANYLWAVLAEGMAIACGDTREAGSIPVDRLDAGESFLKWSKQLLFGNKTLESEVIKGEIYRAFISER